MNRLFLSRVLACLCLLYLALPTGCKKKEVPPPPPLPTPTPVIPLGSVIFIQQGHLARLDIEAKQIVPLTGGKSSEWFPAVSPDGMKVAYWSNAKNGIYNLWKVGVDGSAPTPLTDNEVPGLRTEDVNLRLNNAPAWTPDGKRIYYSLAGDIWSLDENGFNPESVLSGHDALCPSISPDGKTLLFVSQKEDQVFNLWSMVLSDRSLKKITDYTDWNVGSPSYSMDGKKVLFNLYRSNVTQVYSINSDGSNPTNLTTNNHSLCPRFAVKDRKIVFCSYETTEDGDMLNILMENVSGTEPRTLTTDGGTSPSWAPLPPTPAAGLPTPVGK